MKAAERKDIFASSVAMFPGQDKRVLKHVLQGEKGRLASCDRGDWKKGAACCRNNALLRVFCSAVMPALVKRTRRCPAAENTFSPEELQGVPPSCTKWSRASKGCGRKGGISRDKRVSVLRVPAGNDKFFVFQASEQLFHIALNSASADSGEGFLEKQ